MARVGAFLWSLPMDPIRPRAIRSKVAGVTFRNADGGDRQQLIGRHCRPGTTLHAYPERGNKYDADAIGLWVAGDGPRREQIGYIKSGLSTDVKAHIELGGIVEVSVTEVTGGGPGQSLGVNIAITLGARPTATRPVVVMPSPRTSSALAPRGRLAFSPRDWDTALLSFLVTIGFLSVLGLIVYQLTR